MSGYMLHIIRQITTDRDYNRTLLKNRRSKNSSLISKENMALKFKEVPEKELKIIKLSIRKKLQKEKRQLLIRTLIGSVIILIGIYIILSKIIT